MLVWYRDFQKYFETESLDCRFIKK